MPIAGRTFLDLQEEVLGFQFNAPKYRPLVRRWLNDAQRKAVKESEMRTQAEVLSIATVAGTATYGLPEDFGRLIGFSRPGVGDLEKEDLRGFDELPSSSGAPAIFAAAGEDLNLWPTPDGTYELRLRYWRLPADMEEDSDEPEIAPENRDLLVAYAMHKAYARENDYAAATFWKGEWETGLLKMRGEVQSDMSQGPQQVGGAWPGG